MDCNPGLNQIEITAVMTKKGMSAASIETGRIILTDRIEPFS